MNDALIRFADLPWIEIAPGAREKRFTDATQVLRLVQFSPPFQESEPCIKAHVGFVVSGEFSVEFTDSSVHFREGDALSITAGPATAHRAIVTQEVTLFLVEAT
ncbi:phosrestin [Novipirellula sp. SH528]|uniref:phosrestin n=1 Tax=Novipirellula sp. SH528 TaxID=3454466 RepID=UPI003FA09D3F